MDTLIELTDEERKRFAPYHLYSEFTEGFDDYVRKYQHPSLNWHRRPDVEGPRTEAYDKGSELARIRHRDAVGRIQYVSAGATRRR